MSTCRDEVSSATAAAAARSERNRLRARELRAARLAAAHTCETDSSSRYVVVGGSRLVDSGGGFLVEEEGGTSRAAAGPVVAAPPSAPSPLVDEWPRCEECDARFPTSWLLDQFGCSTCDACRSPEGRHALVPRTEARRQYLLQDCDLDQRGGPLRALCRRNPHRASGPAMRLYLRSQLERRACEVWGSLTRLEEERRERDLRRERQNEKKYRKELRALRMEARGGLYDARADTHEHQWGAETELDDDQYRRQCDTCGATQTYEKM